MGGNDAAPAHERTTDRRPLRADARRNRERILLAAGELISAQGEDVSMDDIAARAGVGMGTIYRRFPTKEALVEHLVEEVRGELVAAADRALARRDGSGLEVFLRAIGRYFAARPGCVAALWHHSSAGSPSPAVVERLEALLSDARAHGRVGGSIVAGDVITLLWAMHAIIATVRPGASPEWERHLDLHLAGFAASAGADPVPVR